MKLHLCCGSIYLKGYYNCDVDGMDVNEIKAVEKALGIPVPNPNETDLEHYFKHPFEKDVSKRIRSKRIIDKSMEILSQWPFNTNSIDEIVIVSAFEHFEHLTELPHIINEAWRVLKCGGLWRFDFPDIRAQVDKYYVNDPEFCMELIYCNHKDKYSVHQWGYTLASIQKYLKPSLWKLESKDVVKHDYPMIGMWATKI